MISDYLMLLTGIIEQQRGTSTLFAFVQSVWKELRFSRSLNYVDIKFCANPESTGHNDGSA